MAKPGVHAASSAQKFGGDADLYEDLHQFMDSSKAAHASVRHRAVFHSREGIELAVRVQGHGTGLTDTVKVAEQHVEEDLGRIPPLEEYLCEIERPLPWMRFDEVPAERHAEEDAKRYGGSPEDYVHIHEFMDLDASGGLKDPMYRLVLHHAFGCFVAETAFGPRLYNSNGKVVYVRDLAEYHVIRELKFIPDLGEWLRPMRVRPWMSGLRIHRPCND